MRVSAARPAALLSAALCAAGVLLPVLTGPAGAESGTPAFLTRAEVEGHMREAVFCYYPDHRFACGWAELYTALNPDHAVLHSASAAQGEPMAVLEFRIEWAGDGLCIDHETQGLLAEREAEGYRFPFDLGGLTLLPPADLPETARELRDLSTPESCFFYSEDPEVPGQLLQHVYYGDVAQPDPDPVALIPLFAGGVAIRPY